IVAVAEVIVFYVFPDSFWFWALDFVIGKLFANSLLATLNSRKTLRSNLSRLIDSERAISESGLKLVDGSIPVAVPLDFSRERTSTAVPGANPGIVELQLRPSQDVSSCEMECLELESRRPVYSHESVKS
ncbi:hypothetical protein H0H93_015566, partial [Arthromyces matolae]